MTRRGLKRMALGPHDPRHRLREIKAEREMSLMELSEAAGYVAHGHLCEWLLGKEGLDIPVSRFLKIVEALDCRVEIVPNDKKPGG